MLFTATVVAFYLGAVQCSTTWGWTSTASIVTWVVCGVCLITFGLQQALCVFTTPEDRILPLEIFSNRAVGLCSLGTACALGSFSVTIYYTPLFFAFARGHGPLDIAVRLLPFLGVFISFVVLSGGLLPRIQVYAALFCLAGIIMAVAGGVLTTMDAASSEGWVMGLLALNGAGMAIIWPLGMAVAKKKLDPAQLHGAAMANNLSLYGGSTIGYGIASCVYYSVGSRDLGAALEGAGFSQHAVFEALAGARSPIWQSANPQVQAIAIDTLCHVVGQMFFVVVALGVTAFSAGLLLRWEKLDFGSEGTSKNGQAAN
jgi:hypothetical protein